MGSGALGLMTMQNEFSTAPMRAVWDDKNRVDKICQVERALAIAQGDLGMIPPEMAAEIAAVCRIENIDLRALYLVSARSGHFISGVVKYLQERLGPEAGEYIHFGVTTQDIWDTAFSLQLRDAHQLLVATIKKVTKELRKISRQHRNTVTAGRAHGNHAIPTTLGYQAALVLNEFDRYLTRLEACEDFVFSGVIAGSVSTYAAFGQYGKKVEKHVLQQLGLTVPEAAWHVQRDRFVEYSHILAMISGTLSKVGQNLFDLSRSEIREFEEPYAPGRQGSTAMPTMRNPYMCEAIVNLGSLISKEMPLIYESMKVSHEKDTISWRNQWVAIPEICLYLSAQLNYTQVILQKGAFNTGNIEKNLAADGGMMLSERLMLELADKIGKQTAHQLLYELGITARASNTLFSDLVKQNAEIQKHYRPEQIAALFDPHTYVGLAQTETDRLITLFEQRHP